MASSKKDTTNALVIVVSCRGEQRVRRFLTSEAPVPTEKVNVCLQSSVSLASSVYVLVDYVRSLASWLAVLLLMMMMMMCYGCRLYGCRCQQFILWRGIFVPWCQRYWKSMMHRDENIMYQDASSWAGWPRTTFNLNLFLVIIRRVDEVRDHLLGMIA